MGGRMTFEGSSAVGRWSRAATLYPVGLVRTQTMMHACASAAKLRGGGPILNGGTKAMAWHGTPPPRTVIAPPSRERLEEDGVSDAEYRDEGSCWPHLDALGHDAVVREAPECDQELARQSHDQRLARRRRSLRSLPIPFGERAVLLQP